ncbi:MAG: hypothetical protein JWP15_3052 [Alphaproteobacteria bacterium]|nr:hypothetical protein [Alphaproteobacteria bacterium]
MDWIEALQDRRAASRPGAALAAGRDDRGPADSLESGPAPSRKLMSEKYRECARSRIGWSMSERHGARAGQSRSLAA